MGIMKKVNTAIDSYKEVILFLLFSVFCAFLAWSKGCLNEFGNIEFWLLILGVILLVAGQELGANKKLVLGMLLLMTVGNLIHAALEVYHFHNESYKDVKLDYIIALVLAILVMVIYPKCHRLLSSDPAIALMAAATFGLYAILFLFGTEVGGVKAWFMGIQLTEPVKILFIFVIAGLLSKRQSFVRSGLAILYMGVNAACLAKISEYGTLIIMIFVFLIFLFIFPNKLWWLGGVLLAGVIALGLLYLAGSNLYDDAMERSDPEAFAAVFTKNVRSVKNDNGETVSGVEALLDISEGIESGDGAFAAAKEQLAAGQLTQSDFTAAGEINLSDTIANIKNGTENDWTKYPAADAVAALCGNVNVRREFIQTFCRDDFYGYTALSLYQTVGGGIFHPVKGVILGLYNKAMQRFVIPFATEAMLQNVFGIDNIEKPYQVNQAAKAMRIGGLTGAGSHEFIYVPVMESDMVFSEVISFFGFAMGLFMMLMYMMMFREGIRIQEQIQRAPFHQGVALGLSLMLFIQALVIIAGNMGVFPLTGITLPFVSAGSISMYMSVIMITLLFTISFIKIDEKTSQMDTLFKWVLKTLGYNVSDKSHQVLRKGKEIAKEGAEKVKEMAEEMGQEKNDEDIEEDESDNEFANEFDDEFEDDFEDEDEAMAGEFEVIHEEDDDVSGEDTGDEFDDAFEDDFEDDDETMAWEILSKFRKGEPEQQKPENQSSAKIRNSQAAKKNTFFDDWGDDDDL